MAATEHQEHVELTEALEAISKWLSPGFCKGGF